MNAVVDSSVLVAALTDYGGEGAWCASAINDGPLFGPELVLVEASNILRRLELIGEVSTPEASIAHADLLRLGIELFPFAPFGPRVWELRANLTSYDAWYVAVAESLDCPLLTLDRRLARATGPNCEIVTPP